MFTFLLAASEPSKVPFYIAGAGFAIWAVGLSFVGLTHPTFPDNSRGQRAVILVSLLLAVAAIATAILTSAFPK